MLHNNKSWFDFITFYKNLLETI